MNNSTDQTRLEEFLNLLGLNPEEKSVYSALVSASDQSVLQIAKNANVNRTTTYRILERLKTLGLAEEIVEENRTKFRKTGADKLELLVKEQQEKVRQLNQLLPNISSIINQVSQTAQPGTKVLFYRGQEGIRQMGWNVLKANNGGMGYTYRPYIEIMGEDFLQNWLDEWTSKPRVFRDIYSQAYLDVIHNYPKLLYNERFFQTRFIDAKILDINHQMDIYNNVVAIYNWHEGEIFGVEIYNEKVAALHKQLFEIVWQMAVPEEKLKKGASGIGRQ